MDNSANQQKPQIPLTRRQIVAGAALTPLAGCSAAKATDPILALYEQWKIKHGAWLGGVDQ